MGCAAAQPTSQPQRQTHTQSSPQQNLSPEAKNQQLKKIESLAPQVFENNDPGNGRLGMQEFYSAMQELYAELKNPPPREQLIWAKQKEHDPEGKGWIDKDTFLEIVKEISGYKGQSAIHYEEQQQTHSQQPPVIMPLSQPIHQPPPQGPPSMMMPPSMPMMPQQQPPPMMPQQQPPMPMMHQQPPPMMPQQQPPMMPPPMMQQQPPSMMPFQQPPPMMPQQQPPMMMPQQPPLMMQQPMMMGQQPYPVQQQY